MITVLISHTQWYIGSFTGSPQSWVGTRLHTGWCWCYCGTVVSKRTTMGHTHWWALFRTKSAHCIVSMTYIQEYKYVCRFNTALKRWAHKPFWFFTSTTSVVCTGVGDLPTVNMWRKHHRLCGEVRMSDFPLYYNSDVYMLIIPCTESLFIPNPQIMIFIDILLCLTWKVSYSLLAQHVRIGDFPTVIEFWHGVIDYKYFSLNCQLITITITSVQLTITITEKLQMTSLNDMSKQSWIGLM